MEHTVSEGAFFFQKIHKKLHKTRKKHEMRNKCFSKPPPPFFFSKNARNSIKREENMKLEEKKLYFFKQKIHKKFKQHPINGELKGYIFLLTKYPSLV